MIFNPPQYEWKATTVREALEYLKAVEDMIEAHMSSLAPQGLGRFNAERNTPAELTLSLDLSGLVERINDRRTVEAIAADFDLGDLD